MCVASLLFPPSITHVVKAVPRARRDQRVPRIPIVKAAMADLGRKINRDERHADTVEEEKKGGRRTRSRLDLGQPASRSREQHRLLLR